MKNYHECDRCGTCCKVGLCSLGKEDSEGKCIYLNPISDGKYECKLITDSVYPMQKFIDIIWLGRGCALKTYEKEIFEYYKETYK